MIISSHLTIRLLPIFWACWLLTTPASASEPALLFKTDNHLVQIIELETLKKTLESQHITLFDDMHQKQKQYKAFRFYDVIELAYGENWRETDWTSIIFTAVDGYEAISDTSIIPEDGAWLAYADMDNTEGWEPITRKGGADPAPFYLVWSKSAQTAENGYPWPWQISALNLVTFEEQYAAVVPQDVARDTSVYQGYQTFRTRCISCHSISKQGGDIGPDLNAPRNILSYRSEAEVKAYIRKPSSFRYSKMPDFDYLTDKHLNDLVDYLWYLNRRAEEQ